MLAVEHFSYIYNVKLYIMQPLPYHWFIITVIISVAGLTGFVLLDWRKTGRLRDILQFVSHPVEDCYIDLNIRSILMTLLWYLIIQYFFNFSYAGFIDRALFDAPFPKNNISDASSVFPLWFILLCPPLLEETAFRLPLRRRRILITISATTIAFILSAAIFSMPVYSVTWHRAAVCTGTALLFWNAGYKWVQKMPFRTWFWLIAVLFSFTHLINYSVATLTATGWMRIILREAFKIPGALVLGYARLHHGIFAAIAIHMVNNLIPLTIQSLTSN